ncbi:MAG: DUF4142 domain-containing protein [Gammaproteobacteria bacterium]|nr:MAG: DUF4142 domain-containing protein [Gammaproteobacteria bacterium]
MSIFKVVPGLIFISSLLFPGLAMATSVFTNQNFIDVASIKSISEVETAKIALQKSDSVSVKAYAQQVIKEQTAFLLSLRKLSEAEHLQMLSDTDLQTKARSYVFQRKGKSFDAAYADMRLTERKKSVSLFREAAEMATGDVKQYAIQQLPTLMHHLYMAQTLVTNVENSTVLMADNNRQL